jgi:hypothetical protein
VEYSIRGLSDSDSVSILPSVKAWKQQADVPVQQESWMLTRILDMHEMWRLTSWGVARHYSISWVTQVLCPSFGTVLSSALWSLNKWTFALSLTGSPVWRFYNVRIRISVSIAKLNRVVDHQRRDSVHPDKNHHRWLSWHRRHNNHNECVLRDERMKTSEV